MYKNSFLKVQFTTPNHFIGISFQLMYMVFYIVVLVHAGGIWLVHTCSGRNGYIEAELG